MEFLNFYIYLGWGRRGQKGYNLEPLICLFIIMMRILIRTINSLYIRGICWRLSLVDSFAVKLNNLIY